MEEKGEGNPFFGNLIHDASSVIIDGQTIILEDSYYYHEPFTLPGDPEDDLHTFGKDVYLDKAILSENKKWRGGIVQWSEISSYYHKHEFAHPIIIWNAEDGATIFHEIPEEYFYLTNRARVEGSVLYTFDLRFLRNDRYFFSRNAGPEIPEALMLDMETFEFIPVNRDIALTSDESYYVTERDGLPSLMDANTHEILMRYDPGSTMTACCFSPDDRTLYIACEDLQIYAFDSSLPTTSLDWKLHE
ncbi:MAG: hypothetical protein JXR73_15635 [Candidatus Omnitrophica bacterium]|nr:hypothetical protein [Candidatus Omnitrophota bacterium]